MSPRDSGRAAGDSSIGVCDPFRERDRAASLLPRRAITVVAGMQAERKDTVESEVLRLVEQLAPTRGREVTPAAKRGDLGLDSLAVADLAVAVEERFGVRLVDAGVAA